MQEFFVSFRVSEMETFVTAAQRRQSIYDALNEITDIWAEPTSFIIFRTTNTIRECLRALTQGLDETYDMMLIRRIGYKSTLYWGSMTQTTALEDLVPEAMRVSF